MFKFKGQRSTDMKVVVGEITFLGVAPLNYETTEVTGMDGDMVDVYNYLNYSATLNDVVIMDKDMTNALAWLHGEGELEYLGKRTRIRFLDSYAPKRYMKPFSVPYVRSPFWYKLDTEDVWTTDSTNEGNVRSKPLIRLSDPTGDKSTVTVNGVQFTYTFENSETEVLIDCHKMTATYDGFSRDSNLEIGFQFPVLEPGTNTVLAETPVTVEFKRKDVWL